MELLPEIIKLIQLNLPQLASIGLAIIAVVAGNKYRKIRRILFKVFTLFTHVVEASNDDQYTQEEVNEILEDIRVLLAEFTDDPAFDNLLELK